MSVQQIVSMTMTHNCGYERFGSQHSGQLDMEMAQSNGERIIAQELRRLGLADEELLRQRKNDPQKLAIFGRLRRETTLTLKSVPSRVGLGTSKSANAKFHTWLKNNPTPSINSEYQQRTKLRVDFVLTSFLDDECHDYADFADSFKT